MAEDATLFQGHVTLGPKEVRHFEMPNRLEDLKVEVRLLVQVAVKGHY